MFPLKAANDIHRLRHLTLIEGGSFLLLLFVAMPLKYFAGMRMAVTVVGWAHGILVCLVIVRLAQVMSSARWSWVRGGLVLLGVMLPFGPFVMDRHMRRYQIEAGSY